MTVCLQSGPYTFDPHREIREVTIEIFLGIQTRRTVCIRIADDEVVSNGLCDPDEIPEDISQTCRTNPCPEE